MMNSTHKERNKTSSSLCCGIQWSHKMFFRQRSATAAPVTAAPMQPMAPNAIVGTGGTTRSMSSGAAAAAMATGSNGMIAPQGANANGTNNGSTGSLMGGFFGTLFASSKAAAKEASSAVAARRSGGNAITNNITHHRKSTLMTIATTTDSVVPLPPGATEKQQPLQGMPPPPPAATVMKAIHHQVAPITTEQPQQIMNGINGIAKLASRESTTRLDGRSEQEIIAWMPTDYERDLVKQTWSDDFDFLYELGAAIYTYIFEHNPQAKVLFPKIHRHGDKWRESNEFRSQALKFVQTISFTSKNLYHMDEIHPRLHQIGEMHVKYASRGFKPEYWNSFLDAMEFALTEHINSVAHFTEKQRKDAARVWRQLASYIIVHMRRGYQEGELKLRQFERRQS